MANRILREASRKAATRYQFHSKSQNKCRVNSRKNRIRKVEEIKQYRTITREADPIEALRCHAGTMQFNPISPITSVAQAPKVDSAPCSRATSTCQSALLLPPSFFLFVGWPSDQSEPRDALYPRPPSFDIPKISRTWLPSLFSWVGDGGGYVSASIHTFEGAKTFG